MVLSSMGCCSDEVPEAVDELAHKLSLSDIIGGAHGEGADGQSLAAVDVVGRQPYPWDTGEKRKQTGRERTGSCEGRDVVE